jgi:alpha-beta hydrolase superfamily lysophospholipase
MICLASNGYRCIAHDRRGHGRGLCSTLKNQVNGDRLTFIKESVRPKTAAGAV